MSDYQTTDENNTLDVLTTPLSDAQALSDRELAEASYVMLRAVSEFAAKLSGLMDSMVTDMKDNPMMAMMFGKKKK